MARKVFYSFYFDQDKWRVGTVRSIGKLESAAPLSDNDWEEVQRKGDAAIKNWIDGQMWGKSCCVVLAGEKTASRKWVKYEIEESWKSGKGVVGIRIHKLLDSNQKPSAAGANPFDITVNGTKLSSVVKLHDPTGLDSKAVYASICDNLEKWVEDAIKLRADIRG